MSKKSLALVTLAILAVFLGNFIGTRFLGDTSNAKVDSLAMVLNSPKPTLNLGIRTKETGCKIRGPLPDPACTPGAVFPNMAPQEICISGYTKTVRNVTASTKKKVYAEYGLTYPQPTGSYEADHLIPLELGGSNDISNLFPEAANPAPGFHEKDLVENFLHDQVCTGRADLVWAQNQIASDWITIWNSLTPQEIKNLKSQWAN